MTDAKLRPYESAKVVERKSGEYALYLASSNVPSGVTILDTSYAAPVLSYELSDEMGRYLEYHVLV